MSPASGNALIIFVKNPVPGKVKTRLESGLGSDKTLSVYRRLIALTLREAAGCDADVYIYFGSEIPVNTALPDGFRARVQQTGALGKRMTSAFLELFAEGYERICIIGSDCPQLRTRHIDEAFQALETCDVAIGPASDGGYYLMGMRADHTRIFGLESWSHESVYSQTLALIHQNKLSYAQLEQLSDLDEADDYKRLSHHLEGLQPVQF